MTFEGLAKAVADYFKDCMKEEGFESFEEMVDCYWWTANEIKDEVDSVLRGIDGTDAYIDEFDRSDVLNNGELISYRKFSAMWHKALKA